MRANVQPLRRPAPLTVAGSAAPTLPRPPAQLQDRTDRALADELSSRSNSGTLGAGCRQLLGQQERRRRPQLAGSKFAGDRPQRVAQQRLQQVQPQLPWQRHEQSSDNAPDLADGPAPGSAAALAIVMQQRELLEAAASLGVSAASLQQESGLQRESQQQEPLKQQAPDRRKTPAESRQERQRRLRREALSESYWRSQVDMSTGFPVPLGYAVQWQQPQLRQDSYQLPPPLQQAVPEQQQQQQQQQQHIAAGSYASAGLHAPTAPSGIRWPSNLRPAFRSSPRNAAQRQLSDKRARILFLDEGNTCRSVLAESIFSSMLAACDQPLDVAVESASIGPAVDGQHDSRIVQVAGSMGVPLVPRRARVFDEINDIVGCDLVLVMDSFDATEVLREVAVMDAINRGGSYSMRIRMLAPFADARKRVSPLEAFRGHSDIADPLYGNAGGAGETAALHETACHLRVACAGLINYLEELNSRCVDGMTLRMALEQSLRCPLLGAAGPRCLVQPPRIAAGVRRAARHQAVAAHPDPSADETATDEAAGSQHSRKWGYWQQEANVEREVRAWMAQHKLAGRLPTNRQLRDSGSNSLAIAISKWHGGYVAFGKRMRLRTRRGAGLFKQWDSLEAALQPLLLLDCDAACPIDWDTMDDPRSAPCALAAGGSSGSSAAGSSADSVPEGCRLMMPSQAQLLAAEDGGLLLKAVNEHGGLVEVARRLGVTMRSKGRLSTMAALENELRAFIGRRCLGPDAMPLRAELIDAGRRDIANAVTRFGGFQRVADQLHLLWHDTRGRQGPTSGKRDGDVPVERSPARVAATAQQSSSIGREQPSDVSAADMPQASTAEESPALREAACEVAALMDEQRLDHVPGRAELEALGQTVLYYKVTRSGGMRRLAKLLGMPFHEPVGRTKGMKTAVKAGDKLADFIWV